MRTWRCNDRVWTKAKTSRSARAAFGIVLIITLSSCAKLNEPSNVESKQTAINQRLTKVIDKSKVNPKDVYTFTCGLIEQRPIESTPNCADFGEAVIKIKWSTWSPYGAEGVGIYSINDCNPNCADGVRHEETAHVTLNDLYTDGSKYFLTVFSFQVSKPALPGHKTFGTWNTSEDVFEK